MKKILYLIMILMMLGMTQAYTNSSLQQYYTFGDGLSASNIYDVHSGKYMYQRFTPSAIVTGIQGNATRYDDDPSFASTLGNYTGIEYDDISFTINYWQQGATHDIYSYFSDDFALHFQQGNVNTIRYGFSALYSTNYTHYQEFSSGYYNSGGGSLVGLGTVSISSLNIPRASWVMITITYNHTINQFKYYINNNNIINITWDIPTDRNIFDLTAYETAFDELSIWNTVLNSTDISFLYNNGSGRNYISTMSYGATSNYTENTTYAWDGMYHDYCDYNIVCSNYNVTLGYCVDEPRKACDIGQSDCIAAGSTIYTCSCADTFDSYKSAGLENLTNSFSAECYNDSFIWLNRSYVGQGSAILIDYCMGSMLCHHYNISLNASKSLVAECPVSWLGMPNKQDCLYNNIYGSCQDNKELYGGIDFYPDQMNFSGRCVGCLSDCVVENGTACDNNQVVTCLRTPNNCLQIISTKTCSEYCDNGYCVSYVPSTITDLNATEAEEAAAAEALTFTIFLFLMVAIFIGFFVLGIALDSIKIFAIVGIVLDAFLLFLASLPSTPLIGGIIPIWITILLGIIIIILGGMLIIRPSQGQGG